MSRSTTSLASSHTFEVDRYDRSHRLDETANTLAEDETENELAETETAKRLAQMEKRIDEIERRTSRQVGSSSPPRSAPPSSDRGFLGWDAKKKKPATPATPVAPAGPPGPPGLGGPGAPNDLYKPKTLKFWLILVSNFLAMFLVALDRTIVATAIPQITDDFHSLGDIGWYGSAYMLTTAASQLVFGRLYKYYNMKWVFLICVLIFEAGSVICGAAPSSPVFIAGRAIAGLGSAGIFSGAMMIMIPMIPLHKRPMFQSMFGMIFGIASVLGPLVGGAFTTNVSWRWCFYINLPIGAFTLFFMFFFWNPPHRELEAAPIATHIKRLDPIGTVLFIPSVVCLLLALQWGGATYSWSSWRIVLLFVFFAVLAVAFAIVQILTPETASIPARIITQRSVFLATMFTFFIAGSMLMLVYYMPIWFQTVKLVAAVQSGIYTLPLVMALVASSILTGFATQKIGYYVPSMLLSPSIMAIGEGLLSTMVRSTPQAQWVGFQFLSGFGLGMGMQTGSLAVQTVLPMADVSMGVALIFFAQQLGGAIFTTVGQTILSNLLVAQLSGIEGIDVEQIVNNGATELVSIVPAGEIDRVIDVYNYALTKIFLAAMALAFAALAAAAGMEWKNIKPKKPGAGAPPGAAGPPSPDRKQSAPGAVQNGIPLQDDNISNNNRDVEMAEAEGGAGIEMDSVQRR